MARPIKKGLSYFPKDVDYYEDFKIMDLMNEYGPLGQTIYDVVISMIYREGYFLEFKNFEQLRTFRLKSSRQSVTDGLTKKTLCYKLFSLVRI